MKALLLVKSLKKLFVYNAISQHIKAAGLQQIVLFTCVCKNMHSRLKMNTIPFWWNSYLQSSLYSLDSVRKFRMAYFFV